MYFKRRGCVPVQTATVLLFASLVMFAYKKFINSTRHGFYTYRAWNRLISMKNVSCPPNMFSDSRKKILRKYLIYRAALFCHDQGLNERGASQAFITSTPHHGGTDSSEPFHFGVRVVDDNGKYFTTQHNGKETITFHVYAGLDKQDYAEDAYTWWEMGGKDLTYDEEISS